MGFLHKERLEVLTEEAQPERDFHLKKVFCPLLVKINFKKLLNVTL